MFLGIALTAASLWVIGIAVKKSKMANKRLTLGVTYTIGG